LFYEYWSFKGDVCHKKERHRKIINLGIEFDMLAYKILLLFAFVLVTTISISPQIYAQTDNTIRTSDQTTLSGNLENNPVAQDILKKIEQTKRWIVELEKRNYDLLEPQRELNEKREQVLKILQQDLIEWEAMWEEYSPRNAYAKFVDKKPEWIQGVFWDQFEFTESKAEAGKIAFNQVRYNGGTFLEARQAYFIAAESRYIELIAVNRDYNVKNNLASVKLQTFFDNTGQFIRTPENREALKKQFQDYRTQPAFLKENQDYVVYSPVNECRKGYVLIYLQQQFDSVCMPISTAEMYEKYNMGHVKNWPSDK
jgi:hypothetical protein